MKYTKHSKVRRRQQVRTLTTVLLAAPRFVAPLGALAAAAAVLSACVPAMTYEEAASAAQVESEGRRRAEVELSAAKGRISALEGELKSREQKLETRDQKLAEAGLERGRLAKERDDTSLVLDQLRSDLSLANDSIRSFAANNQRLERALASGAAEPAKAPAPLPAQPSAADSAAEVRALTESVERGLAASPLKDRVKVIRRSDGVTIAIPERTLFAPGSATPSPEALLALDAASRWLEARPAVACRLREAGSAASMSDALGRDRRDKLVRAIEERKLGQRIVYQPSAEAGAADTYDLSFVLPGGGVPTPTKALTPTPAAAPPKIEAPAG